MNINLVGDSHPEMSDDELLKTFCERVWDNPAFAARVSRVLLPWQPHDSYWRRHNLCGSRMHTASAGGGFERENLDTMLTHQGYEVFNKVPR